MRDPLFSSMSAEYFELSTVQQPDVDCGFLLAILTNGTDYPDISVGDITLTFRLDNAISFPKQPSSAFDFLTPIRGGFAISRICSFRRLEQTTLSYAEEIGSAHFLRRVSRLLQNSISESADWPLHYPPHHKTQNPAHTAAVYRYG